MTEEIVKNRFVAMSLRPIIVFDILRVWRPVKKYYS
jgi:hypothetical protein